MLQPILHSRTDPNQTMAMNQQLAKIALGLAGTPQTRKAILDQQLQDVGRIAPIVFCLRT